MSETVPVMSLWDEAEPVFREKAYRRLFGDPSILLMEDSALGVQAEKYHARLLGYDDQHVSDLWLTRPEPLIFVPIPLRTSSLLASDEPALVPLPKATYHCQNAVSVVTLAAEYAPPGVELRPDFTFRVAYLLYKRR